MSHSLNATRSVAVANDYYWQDMVDYPRGVKVQRLGRGGVAYYGIWNGRDTWPVGWAPLPRRRPIS